ncbi:MAG: oligopeptide/dipeptide ABC transporter ATP-binding protein [Pseudomonadota bacterium]
MSAEVALQGVWRRFDTRHRGQRRTLNALRGIDLAVAAGETLGLVGESGCGKSTLARLILRLDKPTAGRVMIDGTDIATLEGAHLQAVRERIQMVFQDPQASLNPRMTARAAIAEPLRNFGRGGEAHARVPELAKRVGLSPWHLDRYPHELSGGQCQRVGIARAIALSPDLIVADEPVSALDVSIQAQILNLIADLKAQMGLTLVFVSHDLSVVSHVADRVAVMYMGRIVEVGPARDVLSAPHHPYTRLLLSALPRPIPASRQLDAAPTGELPSPLDPPSGCAFRTRCPRATSTCAQTIPELRRPNGVGPGHEVACHHTEGGADG